MSIILLLFLLPVVSCPVAFAQHTRIDELRRLFEYDQKLPLHANLQKVITDGIFLH